MNESIIAINENTWRIEGGGVRLFLLSGSERALLIDTGMTLTDARAIAQSLTDKPLELLNTHADRDHIAGNAAFDRFYMHPAEAAHYRESGLPGQTGDIPREPARRPGMRRGIRQHGPSNPTKPVIVWDQAFGRILSFG